MTPEGSHHEIYHVPSRPAQRPAGPRATSVRRHALTTTGSGSGYGKRVTLPGLRPYEQFAVNEALRLKAELGLWSELARPERAEKLCAYAAQRGIRVEWVHDLEVSMETDRGSDQVHIKLSRNHFHAFRAHVEACAIASYLLPTEQWAKERDAERASAVQLFARVVLC